MLKIWKTVLLTVFFFFNYSFSQNLEWAKTISTTSGSVVWGNSVAVDNNGNVYLTGAFGGIIDADPGTGTHLLTSHGAGDTYVTKLNSNGEFIWAFNFGGSSQDLPHKIKIDNSGNIVIVGHFSNSVDFDPSTNTTILVSPAFTNYMTKFDSDGNFIWAVSFGAESCYDFDFDANDNIYAIGFFGTTMDFDPSPAVYNMTANGNSDIFILKLNSSGAFIWAKQTIGADDSPFAYSIKVIPSQNCFIFNGTFFNTIDFDSTTTNDDLTSSTGGLFIAKYNLDGNFIWTRQISSSSPSETIIDTNNNIYTVGTFTGSVDFDPNSGTDIITSSTYFGSNYQDSFINKLDINGNYLGTKTFGGELEDKALWIDKNSFGEIYVAGLFKGTADLDPGSGVSNLISAGDYDIYIQKFDADLNLIWAQRLGNINEDKIKDMFIDSNDNLYLSGNYVGSIDVDFSSNVYNIDSDTSTDAFFIKYDGTNFLNAKSFQLKDKFKIFPNPATNELHINVIDGDFENFQYKIINVNGQKFIEGNLTSLSNNIGIQNIPSGIYFLNLKNDSTNYTFKVIKK